MDVKLHRETSPVEKCQWWQNVCVEVLLRVVLECLQYPLEADAVAAQRKCLQYPLESDAIAARRECLLVKPSKFSKCFDGLQCRSDFGVTVHARG